MSREVHRRDVRIGIDVGGTNTDAVAMRGSTVVASVKRPTTPGVADGIVAALEALFADPSVHQDQILSVMVGTTQFVNAVVQARGLARTGVVRLGLPATAALPPLVDWPVALRRAISDRVYLCRGGHEYDGSVISPLDHGELRRAAEDMAAHDVTSVAITSVFSPINEEFEREAAAVISATLPEAMITLSSSIGRIGLLERENATVMNACLLELASRTIDALQEALSGVGLRAPLYVSQNDGTVMSAEYARRLPVATFASGPTNSMRGAAYLSGLSDAVVIDIGGTTTDVGVLTRGFPRPAPLAAEVGGVRTNFRMPDVLSIGIGGGSLVRHSGEQLTVGPESVGFELTRRAIVFGGDDLTASDLMVADGRVVMGDASLVADLDRALVERGLAVVKENVSGAVDRMKTSPEPVAVVVVGGGSPLLPDHLPGASRVHTHEHGDVANAIGAAMAQVGGEIDRIVHAAEGGRRQAVERVVEEAVRRAVDSGAEKSSVEVVEIDEVPVNYLPGNALRVRVKAVGDLAGDGTA